MRRGSVAGPSTVEQRDRPGDQAFIERVSLQEQSRDSSNQLANCPEGLPRFTISLA